MVRVLWHFKHAIAAISIMPEIVYSSIYHLAATSYHEQRYWKQVLLYQYLCSVV